MRSAMYGAGDLKSGMFMDSGKALKPKWGKDLDTLDLAKMQGILNHYNFEEGADLTFKLVDGTTAKVTSVSDMIELIGERKRELIIDFASVGKDSERTLGDVSLMVDASEDYVNAIRAGLSPTEARKMGSEYLTDSDSYELVTPVGSTASREVFNPYTAAIGYDRRLFDQYGDKANGIKDVAMRNKVIQDQLTLVADEILGFNAIIGKTDRNGAKTFADDFSAVDETTTFTAAMQADNLSGQSIAQAAGKQLANLQARNRTEIFTAMEQVAKDLNANPSAINELSILQQSTLRSGKYEILDTSTVLPSPSTVAGYRLVGIDVATEVNEQVLKASGFDAGSAIIEQQTLKTVLEAMDGVAVDAGKMKQLEDVMLRMRSLEGTPLYAQSVEELDNLKQTMRSDLDSAIATSVNEFAQTATAGATKSVHKIRNKETMDFLRQHQAMNQKYVVSNAELLGKAYGTPTQMDSNVLYAGALDTTKYKHVAFVKMKSEAVDPWAAKGSGAIVATTEADLTRKIQHFKSRYSESDVAVETTQQIKDRTKADGEYKAQLTLSDSYIDSSMRSDGKLFDLTPQLNVNVAAEMIDGIVNQNRNTLIQAQKLRYAPEISTLEQFHSVDVLESGVGEGVKEIQSVYKDNIKQLLGMSSKDNNTWWQTGQEKAEEAISRQYRSLKGSWLQAQTKDQWADFADNMDNLGLPKVYQEAEDWILSNSKAPANDLSKAISQANGVFSFLMLRVDQAHAMVNAMSLPIMLVPEVKALVTDLVAADPDKLRRLNLATEIPVNAEGLTMPSNLKLMQQATKNFFTKDNYLTSKCAYGSPVHLVVLGYTCNV